MLLFLMMSRLSRRLTRYNLMPKSYNFTPHACHGSVLEAGSKKVLLRIPPFPQPLYFC